MTVDIFGGIRLTLVFFDWNDSNERCIYDDKNGTVVSITLGSSIYRTVKIWDRKGSNERCIYDRNGYSTFGSSIIQRWDSKSKIEI